MSKKGKAMRAREQRARIAAINKQLYIFQSGGLTGKVTLVIDGASVALSDPDLELLSDFLIEGKIKNANQGRPATDDSGARGEIRREISPVSTGCRRTQAPPKHRGGIDTIDRSGKGIIRARRKANAG